MSKTLFDVLNLSIGEYSAEDTTQAVVAALSRLGSIEDADIRHERRNEILSAYHKTHEMGISQAYADQVIASQKKSRASSLLTRLAVAVLGMGGVVTDFNMDAAVAIGDECKVVFVDRPVRKSPSLERATVK